MAYSEIESPGVPIASPTMKSIGSSQDWSASSSTPNQRPHFKEGAKKPSREDDRKEGWHARRLRARRWVPGCCCGMRSRVNRPKHRRRSRSRPGIDATSDDAGYCCSGEGRHERGQSSVPACRQLGGNIRVGLEDSLWMDPGKLANPTPNRSRERGRSSGKPPLSDDDDQWPLCANSGHSSRPGKTGQGLSRHTAIGFGLRCRGRVCLVDARLKLFLCYSA